MNTLSIIGIILIILGAIGLIYGGITYTSKTNVLNIGDFKIEANEKQQLPLSPIVSGAVASLGIALVIVGRNRRKTGPRP
jgi:hypothetical protein